MGKHKEWRQNAKKERRRRIRTQKAKERDFPYLDNHEFQGWLEKQEAMDLHEIKEIEKQNRLENEKWIQAEMIAIEQWKKLQELKKELRQKQLEHQAKKRLEWELEKQRKEKEEEKLNKIEEENRQSQEKFTSNLTTFLNGDSEDIPEELAILHESKPDCAVCPFFAKTACCRFGDDCSRNHKYAGISKIILAQNMFVHFGLENTDFNEYDTDIMLEYEDSDTYKDFKEFFYDILPEFEKFGKVVQLKVCHNLEKHLCGNTYIEYEEVRSAVLAYQSLHARWYGGKQLSLRFCQMTSWHSAICGLQYRRRCPKGRTCNYLHVFHNPMKLPADKPKNLHRHDRPRSWRWSESPERVSPKRSRRKRYSPEWISPKRSIRNSSSPERISPERISSKRSIRNRSSPKLTSKSRRNRLCERKSVSR